MFGKGFSFSGYERDPLYLNLGNRKVLDISGCSGIDSVTDGRAGVFADFDNDGDLDVFMTTIQGQSHLLFRNNVGQENHWLRVALDGGASLGRDAFSSVVRLRTSAGILTKTKSGGKRLHLAARPAARLRARPRRAGRRGRGDVAGRSRRAL